MNPIQLLRQNRSRMDEGNVVPQNQEITVMVVAKRGDRDQINPPKQKMANGDGLIQGPIVRVIGNFTDSLDASKPGTVPAWGLSRAFARRASIIFVPQTPGTAPDVAGGSPEFAPLFG